jgi:hypothetical protein
MAPIVCTDAGPWARQAFARSLDLFRSFLTPAQLDTLERRNLVDVVSGDGLLYRIICGPLHKSTVYVNISLVLPVTEIDFSNPEEEVRPGPSYCIHLDDAEPIPDHWLAQLLVIKTDPETFYRIATNTVVIWVEHEGTVRYLADAHLPGWRVRTASWPAQSEELEF